MALDWRQESRQEVENTILKELICGDSATELKKLQSSCIDLTVTSPPYDNLRDYNDYSFDFKVIAAELFRVTKEGGVVVWVVGDAVVKGSETGTSFRQALYFMELGFRLHDTMIFQKNASSSMPNPNRYSQEFEYMFVFSKGSPKTVNKIKDKKNKYAGVVKTRTYRDKVSGEMVYRKDTTTIPEFGFRFNIWKYNIGGGKTTTDKITHPAMFPERLAKDHIISWSNEGDTVLDPFAGSGTTLKMARQLNRNYIGIEISQEYCDIIEKRLTQLVLY
jgi:DNA modification methylase